MTTMTVAETILAVLKSVMKSSQAVAGQGDAIIIMMPIDRAEAWATPIEMLTGDLAMHGKRHEAGLLAT